MRGRSGYSRVFGRARAGLGLHLVLEYDSCRPASHPVPTPRGGSPSKQPSPAYGRTPGTRGIWQFLVGRFFASPHTNEFFGKIKFTVEVLLAA
jgi:hypothetical protein